VLKLVLPMLTRGMASSPRDAEEAWPLFVRSCAYDVDPRRVLPLARPRPCATAGVARSDAGAPCHRTAAERDVVARPLLCPGAGPDSLGAARERVQGRPVRSAMASVMPDVFRLLSNAPRAEGRDAEGRNAEPHAVLPRDDDFGVVVAENDDACTCDSGNFGWIQHQLLGGGGGDV
jgi:hypothetical protein